MRWARTCIVLTLSISNFIFRIYNCIDGTKSTRISENPVIFNRFFWVYCSERVNKTV